VAIVTLGPVVSDARNKCGGVVYSRTRGGAIIRNWLKPHNPKTALQTYFRNLQKTAGLAWPNSLTDTQRLAWNTLGDTLTGKNKLRANFARAGQDVFQERNMNILVAGGSPITDPPQDVPPIGPGPLTLTASSSTQTLTLTPTNALPSGYAIIARATKQLSPGVFNFAKWLRSLISPAAILQNGFGAGPAPVPPFVGGSQYTAADWVVAAGTLTMNPTLGHEDIYASTPAADAEADCTFTLDNLTSYFPMLTARMNPSTGQAYVVLIDPVDSQWGIYLRPAWPFSAYLTLNYQPGVTFTTSPTTLKLNIVGTTITATLQGQPPLVATDSTLSSGVWGIASDAPTYSLSSYLLTGLTTTLPTLATIPAMYLAKYGALIAGKKIGLELAYVNLTTGQRLPASAVLTTIS